MSISIYADVIPGSSYSQSGAMTNPLRHSFDGRNGGVVEQRYYLRNDSFSHTYSGIQVQPIDLTGTSIVDGTNGFSWKLNSGYAQPTDDEWDIVVAGDAIETSGLFDTSTYLPFWLRIEVPAGADVESHDDVILRVTATEILV
jgi:hypothetical protein